VSIRNSKWAISCFFKVWNHGIKRRKTAINIIFWDFVFNPVIDVYTYIRMYYSFIEPKQLFVSYENRLIRGNIF